MSAALEFTKMHGAGNDFVVLDRRGNGAPLAPALVATLADRHRGVGFDQLLTVEAPRSDDAVASYRIWNTDGSLAQQCGNGARCLVAWLVRDGAARVGDTLKLDGPAGPISAVVGADGRVRVDMGMPHFAPAALPFLASTDALVHHVEVDGEAVALSVASMGNPHAVLLVDRAESAPVETLGAALERHPWFPERVNVGFAQIETRGAIRLRVFERGVGETLACGSGACAAVAVLRRRALVDARVDVALPGGTLTIEWEGEGTNVWMSGPAAFVYEGRFYT